MIYNIIVSHFNHHLNQGPRGAPPSPHLLNPLGLAKEGRGEPPLAPSLGDGQCRAEAIRVSGAVHESFFEHCLLLGIVVAKATQRLVTTLLPF